MEAWHDYYLLIGTAAATLVGLMFVAVSIMSGYMTEDLRPGFSVFFSPTIVHFAVILAICVLVLAPPLRYQTLAIVLLAIGVLAALYAATILYKTIAPRHMGREVGIDDKLFYGVFPLGCYVILIVASLLLMRHNPAYHTLLAAAPLLLILVCIRNAWDMTVWAVMRAEKK
jgi:hypothetical protein